MPLKSICGWKFDASIALDYEGIYRKNGGSGQSKAITQLFERGDYTAFDLHDQDRFNDICSVTSVLKTYFRSLPVPLLTYDLHEEFMMAAGIKDSDLKFEALLDAVNKLPNEYYYTLRMLMLHLHKSVDLPLHIPFFPLIAFIVYANTAKLTS